MGLKLAETPHKAGIKEGIASLFAPSGKVQATVEFHNNARNGMTVQLSPERVSHPRNVFLE